MSEEVREINRNDFVPQVHYELILLKTWYLTRITKETYQSNM